MSHKLKPKPDFTVHSFILCVGSPPISSHITFALICRFHIYELPSFRLVKYDNSAGLRQLISHFWMILPPPWCSWLIFSSSDCLTYIHITNYLFRRNILKRFDQLTQFCIITDCHLTPPHHHHCLLAPSSEIKHIWSCFSTNIIICHFKSYPVYLHTFVTMLYIFIKLSLHETLNTISFRKLQLLSKLGKNLTNNM